MSGLIFRFFFFVLSFLVLWLQPNSAGDYKPFFITLFIFIGSWWIDKIAAAVDGVKSYKKMLNNSDAKHKKHHKTGVRGAIKRFLKKNIAVCKGGVVFFFVCINALVTAVSICIGAFLFLLSIMGIMNFVSISDKGGDSQKPKLIMAIHLSDDSEQTENLESSNTDRSYEMQQCLFPNWHIFVTRLFYMTTACVILELIYLVIYAFLGDFYHRVNGEQT